MKAYTRSPVGAHYGTGDWALQRLTAVVMAIYTVALLACLLWEPPASHAELRAMFAGDFFRVGTMLFVAALLYHAWVGMRDIFMDYVKPTWIRLGLSAAVGAVLVGYLIWAAAILWGGAA